MGVSDLRHDSGSYDGRGVGTWRCTRLRRVTICEGLADRSCHVPSRRALADLAWALAGGRQLNMTPAVPESHSIILDESGICLTPQIDPNIQACDLKIEQSA